MVEAELELLGRGHCWTQLFESVVYICPPFQSFCSPLENKVGSLPGVTHHRQPGGGCREMCGEEAAEQPPYHNCPRARGG